MRAGLCYAALDAAAVRAHVECVEDTHALRQALPGLGLVAFVGDGTILPRWGLLSCTVYSLGPPCSSPLADSLDGCPLCHTELQAFCWRGCTDTRVALHADRLWIQQRSAHACHACIYKCMHGC